MAINWTLTYYITDVCSVLFYILFLVCHFSDSMLNLCDETLNQHTAVLNVSLVYTLDTVKFKTRNSSTSSGSRRLFLTFQPSKLCPPSLAFPPPISAVSHISSVPYHTLSHASGIMLYSLCNKLKWCIWKGEYIGCINSNVKSDAFWPTINIPIYSSRGKVNPHYSFDLEQTQIDLSYSITTVH